MLIFASYSNTNHSTTTTFINCSSAFSFYFLAFYRLRRNCVNSKKVNKNPIYSVAILLKNATNDKDFKYNQISNNSDFFCELKQLRSHIYILYIYWNNRKTESKTLKFIDFGT